MSYVRTVRPCMNTTVNFCVSFVKGIIEETSATQSQSSISSPGTNTTAAYHILYMLDVVELERFLIHILTTHFHHVRILLVLLLLAINFILPIRNRDAALLNIRI